MRVHLLLPLFGILIFASPKLPAQVSSDPNASRLVSSDHLAALTQEDVNDLSSRAQTGDPEAEYLLANLYANGQLVTKDKARSDSLLRQSAEKGYAPAEFQLGMNFYPADPPKAERWLLAAALHGNVDAQMSLGAAYEDRWFGTTDIQEAEKWYRKSAEEGQPDAQASLGRFYEDGEGIKQDYVAAAGWYRKAAEHVPDLGGAGQGRNNLGLLYLQGLGVPKDYVLAYMWFSLAHNERDLQEVQSRMAPAEIKVAKQMVLDWEAGHPVAAQASGAVKTVSSPNP